MRIDILANISERLQRGRIGQPWRERCEIRDEQRHREVMNLLGGAHAKKWTNIPSVDEFYLPPLHMSTEEIQEAKRAKEEQEREQGLLEFIGIA